MIADHVIIGGADEAFFEDDRRITAENDDRRSFSSSTSCSMVSTLTSKVPSQIMFHLVIITNIHFEANDSLQLFGDENCR